MSYPLGPDSYVAAAADLDGDGAPALVIEHRTEGSLGVLWSHGDGSFEGEVSLFALPTLGAASGAVRAADLNGDREIDLAALGNESGVVSVLFNQGGGVFPEKVDSPAGSYPNLLLPVESGRRRGHGPRWWASERLERAHEPWRRLLRHQG